MYKSIEERVVECVNASNVVWIENMFLDCRLLITFLPWVTNNQILRQNHGRRWSENNARFIF